MIDTKELLDLLNQVTNLENPQGRINLVQQTDGMFVLLHAPKAALEQVLAKLEEVDLSFVQDGECVRSVFPADVAETLNKAAVKNCTSIINQLKVFLKVREAILDACEEVGYYNEE